MENVVSNLLGKLNRGIVSRGAIIPWSCPVPSFGDVSKSTIATLGLNPSNREFVDSQGKELSGRHRRFHTLRSLGIGRWEHAEHRHFREIAKSCRDYFSANPYDGWFRQLDFLLSGSGASYYDAASRRRACHLDIVPFATSMKWTELSSEQRKELIETTGGSLAQLLGESRVQVLVLNGSSVVRYFERISGVKLSAVERAGWCLRRESGNNVAGISYQGQISGLLGLEFGRDITVLGFNHNIQSSFGVTRSVRQSLGTWLARNIVEAC